MKALVYHGPGSKAWEDVPDPRIVADTDAIVRVDAVTICGTDLHILNGDVPEVTPGRILGHEAVGTVEAVGSAVKNVHRGDRVLVSCITACGSCRFCRERHYGLCRGGGGWILGHLIDGTQAEYVRVPFAGHVDLPGTGRRHRRTSADGRRHPSDRVRGRRAQRARRARRRRRDRRCRTDRARRDHRRPVVQPESRRRHRSGGRATRRPRSSSAPTSRSTRTSKSRSRSCSN